MELEQFIAEMKGITESLSKGANVEEAQRAINGADVVMKGWQDSLTQKQAKYSDNGGLADLMMKFAGKDKTRKFWSWGSDRALEDPRGFFQAKNANGTFKVPDWELEVAIQTLLDMGRRGNAEGAVQLKEADKDGLATYKMQNAARGGAFGAQGDAMQKALDVTTGAVLIRTDIEPLIFEAILRYFPAYEQFQKIKANGIKHTYDQRTQLPTASLLNNIGDFSAAFTQSTYAQQQSSNIAVMAAPVAIALKLQYAVAQSGMNFDLTGNDNLEMTGAIFGIAKLLQGQIFQGNGSLAGKTLNDEEGLYNTLGFDGLRKQLIGPYTITKSVGETYVNALNRAVAQIGNAGGNLQNLLIWDSYGARLAINNEFINFMKLVDKAPTGGAPTNMTANGIVTVSDWPAQIQNVPADAQGTGVGFYTVAGTVYEDIFVTDPRGLALAYLGSPTPSILELPIGYNNNLSQVFVPFYMAGLVINVLNFHRKVRIAQQIV